MTIWTGLGAALQGPLQLGELLVPKTSPSAVSHPVRKQPQPGTAKPVIDTYLQTLYEHKDSWVETCCQSRADMLQQCMTNFLKISKALAYETEVAKGSYGCGCGEEMQAFIPIMSMLRDYRNAMRAEGQPKLMAKRVRACGQEVVQVFPCGMLGLLFPGCAGEVWIEPGQPSSQGQLYQAKRSGQPKAGGVSLVLGAGNQTVVVCGDILYKLIEEDEVVICKMNPINDYAGPYLREVFAPFVEAGYLEFVYGGKEEGEYLVQHPLVTSIHLTGSAATFNSIVWGSPVAPHVGEPKTSKKVTAELGNHTPYVIVPGNWTAADLDFHADQIIAGLLQNSGHNCLALEVLVTCKSWPQRQALMDRIKEKLNKLPCRKPYYPGSAEKHHAFQARFPEAHSLGKPGSATDGALPWLLAEGLSPEQASCQQETWCGVMQEVCLPEDHTDIPAFLKAAAAFTNEQCMGSLVCCVFIHPEVKRQHEEAVDGFISELKYGTINVNVPSQVGFACGSLPWGAFPGNTLRDVGSGVGFVHNPFLLDHPQKSVYWGTWTYHPKPFWSCTNTCLAQLMPLALLFLYHMDNSLLALYYVTLVAATAMRGGDIA